MTGLVHLDTCTGVRVEHFGLPERAGQPWTHTTRCTGCGAQRVLRVEPTRDDLWGSPLTEPVQTGVPTVHSFP